MEQETEVSALKNWQKSIFVKKKHLTPILLSCKISKVMEMEEILKQALLYDFYGELLTGHQKRVYEDVVLNDYSFSEVAEDLGISRQGVHDMIRRCNRLLADYEEKLHLVEKFVHLRDQVGRIQRIAGEQTGNPAMKEIEKIAAAVLEEL